jgi:hypothetical protein
MRISVDLEHLRNQGWVRIAQAVPPAARSFTWRRVPAI